MSKVDLMTNCRYRRLFDYALPASPYHTNSTSSTVVVAGSTTSSIVWPDQMKKASESEMDWLDRISAEDELLW